jgi:hypothetical protein
VDFYWSRLRGLYTLQYDAGIPVAGFACLFCSLAGFFNAIFRQLLLRSRRRHLNSLLLSTGAEDPPVLVQ